MPDVIAEQGALQDAIESPSTSVSRLGAAGWMKGKVADLNAIGVTENVSRLAAAGRIMGGIYDADPLATSTFYAPLLTTLVLTRGTGSPTFTRATTAYVKDFEDVWRQVPSGAARFEGARVVWNRANCSTEEANSMPTKSGVTTSGTRVTATSGGTYHYVQCKITTAPVGKADTDKIAVFFDVKYVNHQYIWIAFRTSDIGSIVDLVSGVATATYAAHDVITITDIGDGWWRIYVEGDASIINTDLGCVVGFSSDGTSGFSFSAAGTEEVDIRKFSVEFLGQARGAYEDYISVGVLSAPYHGAGVDGIKYFATDRAGAAIPDATLKGYLAEGQRQNRCLYSQDFSNAAWVSGGGGIAVTPNTAVAPDGTTTADTLTASGANGTLIQDLGVVASAAKAGGLYLKRKTGTGNIDLTLDGGSTWTTVAVTSSWLLLEKTQTLANEDFGIRIVTSGDAVYAWQAQVETAAFISSPIPTTTAAVTRNADILKYTSTGNLEEDKFTCYFEFTRPTTFSSTASPEKSVISFGSNVTDASVYMGGYAGTWSRILAMFGTVWSLNSAVNSLFALGNSVKAAYAMSPGGESFKFCIDGGAINSSVASPVKTSNWNAQIIGIGSINTSTDPEQSVNVRNVRIWSQALPDATLQSITT